MQRTPSLKDIHFPPIRVLPGDKRLQEPEHLLWGTRALPINHILSPNVQQIRFRVRSAQAQPGNMQARGRQRARLVHGAWRVVCGHGAWRGVCGQCSETRARRFYRDL